MAQKIVKGDLFNPNNEIPEKESMFGSKEADREIKTYTMFGMHDYIDGDDYPLLMGEDAHEDDNALAKQVTTRGITTYHVRIDSGGKFMNPIGEAERKNNKQKHHTNDRMFEFRGVAKKSFLYYIDFLKTKNIAFLRNAERENF